MCKCAVIAAAAVRQSLIYYIIAFSILLFQMDQFQK
jgi:hypothetical protein